MDIQASFKELVSRSGALVVTLSKNRKWDHPDGGPRIGVDELFFLLREEAKRIEQASAGALSIEVHFLDLRPRLRTEREEKL